VRSFLPLGLVGVAFVALTACSGSARTAASAFGGAPLTPFSTSVAANGAHLPRHIIVIVQENRSFDNLFQQLPGADTQAYGLNKKQAHVALAAISLANPNDPSHAHGAFTTEFDNGKLDGFAQEQCAGCGYDAAYSYVQPSDVTQYYAMAKQYSIADHNLQPNEGPSWPGHLYLIAGQSGTPGSNWYISENPSNDKLNPKNCLAPTGTLDTQIDMTSAYPGTEGDPIYPCINPPTILQEVAKIGLTWKYYTPNLGTLWVAPCDVSAFGCPNNPDVVVPETTILSDIANNQLAALSYVVPRGVNSDHPGPNGNSGGPAWVSSVVDAVGESPYWSNTTIFVVWDDWGGWYDHYTNGTNHPVSKPTDPYEYGFRVPLLAIGPYVKPGYISHVPRDSTSIIHFIEDDFGLPSLNELESQTDDLFEMFDFNQTPNTFSPFDTGNQSIQQRRMLGPDNSPVDSD
jgi:phospholipase C